MRGASAEAEAWAEERLGGAPCTRVVGERRGPGDGQSSTAQGPEARLRAAGAAGRRLGGWAAGADGVPGLLFGVLDGERKDGREAADRGWAAGGRGAAAEVLDSEQEAKGTLGSLDFRSRLSPPLPPN